MAIINFLGYSGYITDEDRKKPIHRSGDYFNFSTCIDLSSGVTITPIYGKPSIGEYSKDLASFMVWWGRNVLPHLNGFSGTDTIKYIVEFPEPKIDIGLLKLHTEQQTKLLASCEAALAERDVTIQALQDRVKELEGSKARFNELLEIVHNCVEHYQEFQNENITTPSLDNAVDNLILCIVENDTEI
jgi:hypothetical protein